jgi:hypothetical protein
MKHLRCYYKEIKTKRQLSLEVPAGFRQLSTLQQDYRPFLLPQKSSFTKNDKVSNTPDDILQDLCDTQYTITSNQRDTTSDNNTNPLAPIYHLHPSIFLLFALLINHLHHFLQKYQCLRTIFT